MQWWANLDQAPEDLDKTIFRDLSPTPKPWVLEVLSTKAHFFGAALETIAEKSRYLVDSDNTQHPTATSRSQNVAVVLKVPKRENFSLAFFAQTKPIWVCDLENKIKIKIFGRLTP
jgi:hypothetical protein